jgi:hypothetical protein
LSDPADVTGKTSTIFAADYKERRYWRGDIPEKRLKTREN